MICTCNKYNLQTLKIKTRRFLKDKNLKREPASFKIFMKVNIEIDGL